MRSNVSAARSAAFAGLRLASVSSYTERDRDDEIRLSEPNGSLPVCGIEESGPPEMQGFVVEERLESIGSVRGRIGREPVDEMMDEARQSN